MTEKAAKPTFRQLTFCGFYSTPVLLQHFHDLQKSIAGYQEKIRKGPLLPGTLACYEAWIKRDVANIGDVVGELRARGHNVHWEE